MAGKRQQFLELFRARMKPGHPAGELDRFIDGLSLHDLRDCLSAYFDEDKYVRERPRSVAVFLRLASRAAAKDAYYALHVDAMVRLPRSPFQLRYAELAPTEKDALQKVITRQKRGLPRSQQRFIEKFNSYMTDRKVTQQKIQQFTDDLTPGDLQGCLRAYIELSQGYEKGNGDASLLIFFGVSFVALQKGGFYFAHEYETNIGKAGTTWHLRFESLAKHFQDRLKRQVADAKVLRADVKVGDTTHKNVPIGKAAVDVAPTATVHHEDAPRTQFSALQRQYIGLYRAYVDRRGHADASRKAMNALQEFLRVHRKFEDIHACVEAYLEDSVKHYGEKQSHQSLVMFFGVLSNALTKGSAYYAFKVKGYLRAPGSIWNKRYEALDKLQYRDRLDAQIEVELKTKARLIDDARAAFYAAHRRDPDLKALREFAVVAAPEQMDRLSRALSDVEVAVAPKVKSLDSFGKAFDAVSAVFRAQKDLLTLVVLVMHCRNRRSLGGRYGHLVYLCGVGLLFGKALQKYPERYHRKGLSDEETRWLLEGDDVKDRYFADFTARLQYLMWKGADAKSIETMARGEGLLQLYSDKLRLDLTPPIEAAAVRGAVEQAWKKKNAEVRAIRMRIQGQLIGRQEIRVGQTIGRFFVLWWDQKNGTVYLETDGLDGAVFHTDLGRLAEIYADDSFYGVVTRNTEHLLTLIPFFFEILSFIPDLVSGGLTGLAKAVVFGYAFEYSIKAIGVDPNIAQVVMLGAGLLARGARPKEAPRAQARVDAPEPNVAGVHTDARATVAHKPATDARMVGSPGTTDVALSNRTVDAPRVGDRKVAAPKVDDKKPRPPGDAPPPSGDPPKKPKDARPDDPALASREGFDPRGLTRDDGRIAVGMHKDADVSARMPGDWSLDGKLPVNENGFALHGPNRAQAAVHGPTYERAFNEQVAKKLAERASHRPVRVDEPHQKKGWASASSTVTSRLKLQARRVFEKFKRQPDASMEIVQKVGDKQAVTEAHLFEATIDPRFGTASRKEAQVATTAWIARNNPRQGYSPDTKVVYHIVAPAKPNGETATFLNKLMKDDPNLEILWYVVR